MVNQQNIYGLFVGVNCYESEDIRPLDFASADVLAVRDTLAKRYGLAYENTVVLADDVENGCAPTRRQILRAMNRFAAAPMKSTDLFLFVFAGHGFSCMGKTFLAACDSEVASEALLRETALSLETVRDFLGQLLAGQQVLILDACREASAKGTRSIGAQAMSGNMTRDIGAVIRPTLEPDMKSLRAKAILCSCWEGQVAHEYMDAGHGWFCHNLLAELDSTADNAVSMADLHTRIKERMREDAWRLLPVASKQVPHLVVEGDVPVLHTHAPGVVRIQDDEPRTGSYPTSNVDVLHSGTSQPVPTLDSAEKAFDASRSGNSQSTAEDIESYLLSGRPLAAIQTLQASNVVSPRIQVLHCLATLMTKPMRELRNSEASNLVSQLVELMTSTEKPLATVLLATLSKHYYRPLRRRFPSTITIVPGDIDVDSMDKRSRQLIALIPETLEILSNKRSR